MYQLLGREDAVETFDERRLDSALQTLAAWKQVAFMAQVGARMIPNYQRFSAETGFGDVSVLKRAFDAAWTWVEFGMFPNNVTELREACERQAPDTGQFRSPYTSAALDAANAAAATLDAIERPEEARPTEVASLARDTVDLFVQELLGLDPNAPGFEKAILGHNLMQRELKCQRQDLEELARLSGERQTTGHKLRVRSEGAASGSLDD